MPTRVSEAEMADAVRSILSRRESQSATFKELRELIPKRVHLSRADRAKSECRPGEELWEQILRNIASHDREGFVRVEGGIRLEWRGTKNKSSHAHADA